MVSYRGRMRSVFVFAIILMAVAGAAFLFGPRSLLQHLGFEHSGFEHGASWDLWPLPASDPSAPAETDAVASTAGQHGASKKRVARAPAANDAREPAEPRPERLEPGSGRRLTNKRTASPTAMQAAREDVQVTVYYTQGCRYCTAARRFLTQKGIQFQSHDIEADPSARSRQRALNPQGTVPTLEVDGQVLVGFNAQRIERAIDRAAQRRRER